METLTTSISSLLGLGEEAGKLTFVQVGLRGIIVFVVALILVRLSDRRSLTKKSPFAIVLLVVIASVLARAVNGSGPFFPTLGGAAVIVLVHRLLAAIVCRWRAASALIKGDSVVLVREGELQPAAMRAKSIAVEDIREDLRLAAKTEDLEKIKTARLEVSGNISFIMKKDSE